MGMFSGLEGSLEKYIEGFFKDSFSGRVQPVDIAKKLAREMRDNRRVSISNIYVPNEYTVFLHQSDWESISAFSGALARELQDYVSHKAEEKKYSLAGRPLVKFITDDNISTGSIVVESCFSEAPPEEEKNTVVPEPLEHTQRFTPVKDSPPPDSKPLQYAKIRVDAGPERDKIFSLNKVTMVIGRREDCDIVLSDDSISRSHARLDLHRGVYTIHDLGSTNGIRVNGEKVTSRALKPGDVVTLGTTVCTFKVE
ncbi:FhaA domain-containing protein [Pelotomaculum propionicicum]|uniref:FhaA domain-containing protein n=1 Tax=Pelotomaculum propionicicum TaxID=258475 RepID=UPI003B812DAE